MSRIWLIAVVVLMVSCKDNGEKIKPVFEPISESVYASGKVKSKNQYLAFATVNGIIDSVFLKEGDSVKKGTPILSIANDIQRLNMENAQLASNFYEVKANQEKLKEAKLQKDFAKNKMSNDSILFFRQQALWQQKIGAKIDLEQRELAYQNSKTTYYSAQVRYDDLKRQLEFTSAQSKNNLLISGKVESDYILKSEVNGILYGLEKSKGEMVMSQTPVAIIGDAENFVLEMLVDEYDILKIKIDLPVIVSLDSYKGEVFEAKVTKIQPLMNELSKTFVVEAEFVRKPDKLYPNTSFEASIVIQTKEKAMLIPRKYLLNDSLVITAKGDTVSVETGLKDYQKVEILAGIDGDAELISPTR